MKSITKGSKLHLLYMISTLKYPNTLQLSMLPLTEETHSKYRVKTSASLSLSLDFYRKFFNSRPVCSCLPLTHSLAIEKTIHVYF